MNEKVLDMLAELCEDDVVKENLDIDLFETGLLDSLGFTELLVNIETEFDVVIALSEVEREDMNTPHKIIHQIQSRI